MLTGKRGAVRGIGERCGGRGAGGGNWGNCSRGLIWGKGENRCSKSGFFMDLGNIGGNKGSFFFQRGKDGKGNSKGKSSVFREEKRINGVL